MRKSDSTGLERHFRKFKGLKFIKTLRTLLYFRENFIYSSHLDFFRIFITDRYPTFYLIGARFGENVRPCYVKFTKLDQIRFLTFIRPFTCLNNMKSKGFYRGYFSQSPAFRVMRLLKILLRLRLHFTN